jgi:chromosome segregation ATPase
MNEPMAKNLKVLLREIDTIKNSLGPLLNEVKKVRAFEAEVKRIREESDSKLKKLEFELRRAAHGGHAVAPRDISDLRAKLEYLNQELGRLKNNYVDRKQLEAAVGVVTGGTSKVIQKDEAFSKKELMRVKDLIDEIDNKYKNLINSTTAKTAALIPGFDNLNREVLKVQNTIKELHKKLDEESGTRSGHCEQIVGEINNHKKDIVSNKKTVDKIEKQILDIRSLLDKIEKQHYNSTGEIKNRLYQIEKRIMSTGAIDRTQTEIQEIQAKAMTEQRKQIKETEDKIAKSAAELLNRINELNGRLEGLKEEVYSINTKVNNISKTLGDVEKVL